jgi:hypothetical protein
MEKDFPDLFTISGWQNSDAEHPPGGGVPAYRVVYKTLKTFVPETAFNWPNLLVRMGHGDVHRGGVVLAGAMPTRREGRWLLPQAGTVTIASDTMTFHPRNTKNYAFQAWEENVADLFFVELILHNTVEGPDERIAEGRRRLAYLKTLLEIRFGTRLLSAQITEEIGEVFPDGHFNRNLQSQVVGNEWQTDLAAITRDQLLAFAHKHVNGPPTLGQSDRERLGLACDWYWRSTQTPDRVTEYLELWFVVEALAMPDTTDIRPVRERLAAAFGGNEQDWRTLVGTHFGRRSKLVHGQTHREINQAQVDELRELVQALLETEFQIISPDRRERLRKRAGIA